MNWNDLRVLLALYREGTAKAAAQTLRIDPVTVTRRLEALERDLGATLFQRTTRGLLPTEVAHHLFELAERVETAAFAVERGASGAREAIAGTVRVACPADLGIRMIAPALGRLSAEHPELVVELITGASIVDLNRREADVSLRLVRPELAELVCRRVGAIAYAVYRHRDGAPARWIAWVEGASGLPEGRWVDAQRGDAAPAVRVDRTAAAEAAAAAGLGLALLPTAMGDAHPELVRDRPEDPPALVRDVWMVVHRDLRSVPRVRRVMDFLTDVLAEHAPTG